LTLRNSSSGSGKAEGLEEDSPEQRSGYKGANTFSSLKGCNKKI